MSKKEIKKYCSILNNFWCGKRQIKECEWCGIKPKEDE